MDQFGAAALVRLLVACRAELASVETTLNSLNVFPVPDGDTGTNMRATLDAGLQALDDAPADPHEAYDHVMRGLLRGAQGNSGVIVAEYIRGFSRALVLPDASDATRMTFVGLSSDNIVEALQGAQEAAWKAVGDPVDGTVLSVAKAAAQAAREHQVAAPEASFADLTSAAWDAALASVKSSPAHLRELTGASVIDAGGAGLVVILDCLRRTATGKFGLLSSSTRSWLVPARGGSLAAEGACQVDANGPGFEFMALVGDLSDEGAAKLRADLANIGDSVVVAGGEGTYRVHVHTDEVLTAATCVRAAASMSSPSVARFEGPLEPLKSVIVLASDPVLTAYAKALGAAVSADAVNEASMVLFDGVAQLPGALRDKVRGPHAVAHVVRALEELSLAAQWDDVESGEEEFADEAAQVVDVEALPRNHDFDSAPAIMRAQTWRAARDAAALHYAEAEHLFVVFAVDADSVRAHEFVSACEASGTHVVPVRLESGTLVEMTGE